MTASELKYLHTQQNPDGYFFTSNTMKFFGDTMANYGVRQVKVIDKWTESAYPPVDALELYRRHPVKNGLQKSMYFSPNGKLLISVKEA